MSTCDGFLAPERPEKSTYRTAYNLAVEEGATNQAASLLNEAQLGDGRATYALATWYIHGILFQSGRALVGQRERPFLCVGQSRHHDDGNFAQS